MGSAFHQLCQRYSGTLTPTAPTAIRLWETFYQEADGLLLLRVTRDVYSKTYKSLISNRKELNYTLLLLSNKKLLKCFAQWILQK